MFGIPFRSHKKAQERRFALYKHKYTFMHIFLCALCELTSNYNSSNKSNILTLTSRATTLSAQFESGLQNFEWS